MALLVGDSAPDFTLESQDGPVSLYEWASNQWVVLFFQPADFDPVSTTELGRLADLNIELKNRNAKALVVSSDPVESHRQWIEDVNETQDTWVNFPILADTEHKVAKLYGLARPDTDPRQTARGLFFIDPDKKIRALLSYPDSAGYSLPEMIRLLDSLQLTDNYKAVTPANWNQGELVLVHPAVTDEDELQERFPLGYNDLRPYLRLTPQPDMFHGPDVFPQE